MARKPRVLIADDHPDLVKAVTRVLALDYEVVGVVANGSGVLDAAARLRPDVIIVDLNLPDVSGLEVCRRIRQFDAQTKVVIFTAMDDPALRERAIAMGADAFVCKVGDDSDLLTTLHHLCADGRGET